MPTATPGPDAPVVLVVDDLPPVVRLLQLELHHQGLRVVGTTVNDTMHAIDEYRPAAVVMEVVLPGIKGFEVLRLIKQRYDVPVVFVTTQASEADQAYAREVGADDYVLKPFSPEELGHRIKRLIGTPDATERSVIRSGDLELDLDRKLALKRGQTVSLTVNEWSILYDLASHVNEPRSAAEIAEHTFGEDFAGESRYVAMWMERLRARIEDDPRDPKIICGDAQQGYWLVAQ